jgi:Na+/proline symporter
MGLDISFWQWVIVIGSSLLMFLISPLAKTNDAFFRAKSAQNHAPGVFLLTSSMVISWIFAKSITNAANLGQAYGFVGGLAYATYYFSFLVAGIVIYRMRTRGGYQSIHHFIGSKFGSRAVMIFSLLIAFRLFNEVWSNTMVIGSYFGAKGSGSYYASVLVFTSLTLIYTLKGGLRTALMTDLVQMGLFVLLLGIILGILMPHEKGDVLKFVQSGEWKLSQGLNLLFVALIQIFSYPFHDPVLTDRGFISTPKTTLKSYALATLFGFTCILLFSFVGIYARFNQLEGEATVAVSRSLGAGMMLMMNFIMVTSASACIDSAFASFSKLTVVDLGNPQKASVFRGRIAMVIVAVAGTMPVFLGPEILSATTISGTMVIGFAPVFLCWNVKVPPLAFYLSVGAGVLMGLLFTLGWLPANLILFPGKYGDLLSVNLLGTLLCFALFFATKFLKNEE